MQRYLEGIPGVTAFTSEVSDGAALPLGYAAIHGEKFTSHERLLARAGITPAQSVLAILEGGSNVAAVTEPLRPDAFTAVSGTDALITNQKDAYLVISIADCFPIFFSTRSGDTIALAHAGWKGVVENILPKTVAQLEKLGATADELQVAIGPGIRACHFEVQQDVLPRFAEWQQRIVHNGDKTFADLVGIIQQQLSELGIGKTNVTDSGICTYTDRECFSHRRAQHRGENNLDRMIAVIGIQQPLLKLPSLAP